MSDFNQAIQVVLAHEGVYAVDHAGATKYGISLRFLKDLALDLNGDGTVDATDIKGLTVEQATALYKEHFWDKYRAAEVRDNHLSTKYLDLCVNMDGPQAIRLLQRAVRAASGKEVIDDGKMGDKTIEAINHTMPQLLLPAYRAMAAGYYYHLVWKNKSYEKYLKGWLNRAYA